MRARELDPVALDAEAGALLGADEAIADGRAGEYPVVLGPWAVAEVVRRAALAFGGPQSPLAGRLGTQAAAPAVNLSESPRFAATLPRSYDAQGSPRQPLPLIQDGVAHRRSSAGGVAYLQLAAGGSLAVDLARRTGAAGDWDAGSGARPGRARVPRGRAAQPAPNLQAPSKPLKLLFYGGALTGR